MLESIKDDIKKTFLYGNMVNKIIIVNLAVFVVVLLLKVFLKPWSDIFDTIFNNLQISADPVRTFLRPWTFITHMFLHVGIWHMVFNLIWLYLFGKIAGDLLGDRRVLPVYIYGGLVGAAVFMIYYNLLGPSIPGFAHGASAAVMAVVIAAALTAPDFSIRLLFLGDIKIKYIALVMVILDLVGIANEVNTGGHFGHLGGVFFGWFYVMQLRSGNDMADGFNRTVEKIQSFFTNEKKVAKPKSPLKVKYKAKNITKANGNRRSDTNNVPHQERVDAILEKIKAKGYDNLTDEEKDFLFQASKK